MINKAGGNLNKTQNSYAGRKTDQTELNKAASFAPSDALHKIELNGTAGKTDTIEISCYPSGGDPVISNFKHKIVYEINRDAGPEILKDLKEKYDAGKFKTDPDELARILLENY